MKNVPLRITILLSLFLFSVSPAFAQPRPLTESEERRARAERARYLFQQGQAELRAGHPLEAAVLYLQANNEVPHCDFAYNAGLAYTEAGDLAFRDATRRQEALGYYEEAAHQFRLYMAMPTPLCPGRASSVAAARAEQSIPRLEALVRAQRGAQAQPQPPSVRPDQPPPVSRANPRQPPAPFSRAPQPPVRYTSQRRHAGWIYALAGTGVLLTVAGSVSLGLAIRSDNLADHPAGPENDPAARAEAARIHQSMATGFLGTGVAMVAGSVIWYLLDPRDRFPVRAGLGPDGLAVMGSF